MTVPVAQSMPKSKQGLAIHFRSETPEHYTPAVILNLAVACMGGIDLDPCSNSHDSPNVPALHHYTREDDGLKQEWRGRVYMNPPYGRKIKGWVKKLVAEYEAGRCTEAIALLPGRIDTQWIRVLRDFVRCEVEGRLTFIGNDDPAPFPSVVYYLGEDIGKFKRTFAELGDVWQRIPS